MLLATCPTPRSLLITMMNTSETVIRPRLMSPCICLYFLVLGTGVSSITLQAESVLAILSFKIPSEGSSHPDPSLRPIQPPLQYEFYFLTVVTDQLAEQREQKNQADHRSSTSTKHLNKKEK